MNEQSIFVEALDLETPAARAAFLDRACAGDNALRERVERLLARYGDAGSFLERPAAGTGEYTPRPATATGDPPEAGGEVIGPYKLLEVIGEGGMGTVWMAEQSEPVRRRVALKVVKAGADSKAVLARFEAERQALALMDHPNIAKVLDAGATAQGRPYFAMELVKGLPITRYCDEHRLTPRERLELFIPVCQAVQHAHQKGVIHRDLKPTNVLVARYDDRPVPKVIDFGVAKATGQRLTDATLHTGFGAVVGTLEYMSPEQAGFNQLDVDTRSDIYSLGVLLYELLAGAPPFDRKALERAGILEMLRVIREQEPSKPSAKLSTAEGLPALAASRGTEPKRLTALVRGELDWIVMKALEKDRARRYETANGFAADLLRYLADEPVSACRPSATYRTRKFVRRHKGPVLAVALVVMVLLAGVFGTTWGLVQSVAAADAARQAKDVAQSRLEDIERANRVLGSIFSDLDPKAAETEGRPLQAVLGDRLDKAEAEMGAGIGDALTAARLRQTLGVSQIGLGRAAKAVPLLTDARAALEAELGPTHQDALNAARDLARAYFFAGQRDRASALYADILGRQNDQLGPDHSDTLATMNDLAVTYHKTAKPDRAIPLFEETVERRTRLVGRDDLQTLVTLNNLGLAYRSAGRVADSVRVHEEVRDVQARKGGPDHPDLLTQLGNLAGAYLSSGRPADSAVLYEDVRDRQTRLLGPDHPSTLITQQNLAGAYSVAGRSADALRLLEPTSERLAKVLGEDHPSAVNTAVNLADEYNKAGRLADAARHYEAVRGRVDRAFGPTHPGTIGTLATYGQVLLRTGRPADAEAVLREAYARGRTARPDDWRTFDAQAQLGAVLLDQKKFAEAEPLLRDGHTGLTKNAARIPARSKPRLAQTAEQLAKLYDAWAKPEEAAKWRARLYELAKPAAKP